MKTLHMYTYNMKIKDHAKLYKFLNLSNISFFVEKNITQINMKLNIILRISRRSMHVAGRIPGLGVARQLLRYVNVYNVRADWSFRHVYNIRHREHMAVSRYQKFYR